MFRRKRKNGLVRSGLTLLELVVVMAILAALAGIIIPMMPGLVQKADTTAGLTNLDEVVKAVQLYAAEHNNLYPNNFDSLLDSKGALLSTVPPGTGAPGSGVATWFTKGSSNTTSADVAALYQAGITSAVPTISQPSPLGDWSPTYFPYGPDSTVAPTPVALSSANLAYVNSNVVAGLFGVPTSGTYVIFGLGKYSTISGSALAQPPVYFSTTQGYDPDHAYARFGLVFQTADANGPLLAAKFLGAVAMDYNGLENQDQQMYTNQLINH